VGAFEALPVPMTAGSFSRHVASPAERQQHPTNRTRSPVVGASAMGRYCCKSLRAQWVQFFPGRAGAFRKSSWGSTQTTAHATRGFPSRTTSS
jgi:hypothetical protein